MCWQLRICLALCTVPSYLLAPSTYVTPVSTPCQRQTRARNQMCVHQRAGRSPLPPLGWMFPGTSISLPPSPILW
ncbi:hypothetical protein B0J13DRAFT_539451 [Dactylonectria estremocensis]|uniref:Secreted protein n=1 Tax=Dactylonectria estremocensis TaxID=1079267 RepID=A0A9P9FC72_9HYPO|nr:hypothetical protein B0J13DRAFT_539451 [Dactylonectria estremocensis]